MGGRQTHDASLEKTGMHMGMKHLNIWIVIAGLLGFFGSVPDKAMGKTLALDPGRRFMNVQNTFSYLEDPNGGYTIEDVLKKKHGPGWTENIRGSLNFGYTDSVFWLKGQPLNRSSQPESYVFEIAYPVLDHIQVFIVRRDGHEVLNFGDKLPFRERLFNHRNFLFVLRLDPGESVDLVMRVATTSSMQIPVNVYQEDDMMEKSLTDILGLSLYCGAMLVMVLYNLFLFFSIRESMYFYYVFYVFFMTVWATSINGLAFNHVWPDATVWNDQVIVFSLNGIVFFAAMFAMRFLNAREDYPKNYRVFRLIPAVALVMMVFSYVIPYRVGISSAMILAVIAIAYGFVITLFRLFDGFMLARVFLLAWATVLSGGVVMALSKFGLISRNLLTETAVQAGSVFEVALLSFALAHRLNLEKKQRIEAQNIANIHERHARIAREHELLNERKVRAAREEAHAIQKKATETLEMKIMERRRDLSENLNRINEIHDKIMDSLGYARMIQAAMLPEPDEINAVLPDHSIWYAPRDIVGGDFYYVEKVEGNIVVAVADCTGHGVPGSFMTLIANWELKRIVKGEKCYDPGEILVRMNRRIKKALKQDKDGAFADDGLDMAVCVLNPEKRRLEYAGARIDLKYVSEGEIHTVKGDRRSLGYVSLRGDYMYRVHRLYLESPVTVYLYTDGIVDQPGENTGQRFGSNRLNEVISEGVRLPLPEQCDRLKEILAAYRGERDQVDDMTMVAFVTVF